MSADYRRPQPTAHMSAMLTPNPATRILGNVSNVSRLSRLHFGLVAVAIASIVSGCQSLPVPQPSSEFALANVCSDSLRAWATSTTQFGDQQITEAKVSDGFGPFSITTPLPACTFNSVGNETQVAIYLHKDSALARSTYDALVSAVDIDPDYMLATESLDPPASTFTFETDHDLTQATVYTPDQDFASYMGYRDSVTMVIAFRTEHNR